MKNKNEPHFMDSSKFFQTSEDMTNNGLFWKKRLLMFILKIQTFFLEWLA